VIDSYEQLMEATSPDFTPIYEKLAKLDSIPAGDVLDTDTVFNRGTGEGWLNDGDV
jgi:phenylalanine-4-hydroxylase